MNPLNDIKFYQVYRNPKSRGKYKTKWVREVTKSKVFEEKVKVIRMKAEIINRKISNY